MTPTDVITILNTAGLGVVAYYLLTRVEARLTSMERSVNRLVRIHALDLIRDRRNSAAVRREARELLRELTGSPSVEPSAAEEQEYDDDRDQSR